MGALQEESSTPGPGPNPGGSASEPRSVTGIPEMPRLHPRAPEPGLGSRSYSQVSTLSPHSSARGCLRTHTPSSVAHPLPGCRAVGTGQFPQAWARVPLSVQPSPVGPQDARLSGQRDA